MSAPAGSLVLPHAPQLVFRQLHHDLRAFANHTMDEDDAMPFMARLLGHELDFLSPVTIPPPQGSERQALQKESKVYVAGKAIDVSPLIQQEILKLSDEFKTSEARCLEIWFLASELSKREWIERVDQLPNGSLSTSIPAAARHFLLSEVEYKLNLIKELMRLRMDHHLDRKRREFIITYTNKLLIDDLLSKLMIALRDQLSVWLTVAPLQQSASYWHVLVADTILLIVSSASVQAKDVLDLTKCLHTLCTELNTVVAKVSPHIVNLTAFPQLFECGSRAGTSPEGVVKQVSCLLRAMTTLQMAVVRVLMETPVDVSNHTHPLSGAVHATVEALHQLIMEQTWNQPSFQSITKLAWASFLSTQVDPMTFTGASRNHGNVFERTNTSQHVFPQVEATPQVVKAALEQQVFTHLVHVVLQYIPDAKHDALLYQLFQQPLETLLIMYSTSLLVDVPTIADQQALLQLQSESDGGIASWEGDCLENIIEYAVALCTRNTSFARLFWATSSSEETSRTSIGDCHELLMACRDAAFKNPACLASYIRLVAAAATGTSTSEHQSSECAQLAFHHIKQNPVILSWDHFFAVMNKYQKLLVEAERLTTTGNNNSFGIQPHTNQTIPGARYIRPKELEALEAIQTLIQAVIHDTQLALVFFHHHEWSPVSTLVAFLQCHVQSSLKGEVMKTLALFAQVPEIAPVVWRHMDALQILRTTPEAAVYGHQDIQYELEQYESSAGRYPATRGFLSLLHELFENPHAWNALEGDGRVSAIQYYFEFVVHVFVTLHSRKYVEEEEKWVIASGVLSIFKKILRGVGKSTRTNAVAQGSLAYQLLSRLLSGHGDVLDKVLWILSADGGVDSLETTVSNMYLEHSFVFCLESATKEAEAKHGTLQLSSTRSSKKKVASSARSTLSTWMIDEEDDEWMDETLRTTTPRERAVRHALELLVLVLEKDVLFVQSDVQLRGPMSDVPTTTLSTTTTGACVELLPTILFRHRAAFVDIVQFIKYTKSLYIPRLSVAILQMVSQRVNGPVLLDVLVDSGTSTDVMMGCMNHLWHVYEDEHVSNEQASLVSHDGEEDISINRRRRRTTHGISSVRAGSSSMRTAILDLLLENLNKPAPNLSHLLLGLLRGEAMSTETTIHSGLDVLLTLLSTTEGNVEYPDVAQRCLHVIHQILVQEYSSRAVVHVLESSRYDFFHTQLELLISLIERSSIKDVGELNRRGWFLKTLAVYLHITLQQEPVSMKKIDRIMSLLFQASARQSTNRIVLLRLLNETSFKVMPPAVPTNQQAVSLAEQVTVTMDKGYYKWLRIDVERFCEALEGVELIGGSSMRGARHHGSNDGIDALLQWAIEWNAYSERVAAESHALNSLRELIETIVLEYLASSTEDSLQKGTLPQLWQGLDTVQSNDVRIELISSMASTVLVQVTQQPMGCAQLFEVVAQLLLLLFAELRHAIAANSHGLMNENRRRQHVVFVEMMYKTISHTSTATGNPMAAQNARTLLYSGIVNVMSMVPSSSWSSSSSSSRIQEMEHESFFEATTSIERTNALASHVVDVISRDASEGSDVLRMTLAVSGLEAMISSTATSSAVITKILRERGYLLHFIGLFRTLCELDASFDRDPVGRQNGRRPTASSGMDATTIGTIYECFLSLFSRVASSKEGAIALLEGGVVRVLVDMQNLPSHRPNSAFQHGFGGIQGPTDAYRRAEALYARKWPPVIRLLSSLCASLGQNRMLAQQVLQVVSAHSKLVTGCLKLVQHETPTLSLLREVSHTTFVLRYVTQFSDLCEQALNTVKWDKIAQLIVRVFMLYASEVVPKESEDMSDQDSVWWQKTQPQTDSELREDTVERIPSLLENELVPRLERKVARETVGLLRLTVFGEDKLYVARMILCNTMAFCANRMVQSMDNSSQLIPGKSVLLASASKQSTGTSARGSSRGMKDTVDRRAFVATVDPLWSHAPAIEELVVRLRVIVSALQSAQQLTDALQEQQQEQTGSVTRRQRKPVDATILQHLIEYHSDTLTFVMENVAVVLMTHFTHFMGTAEPSAKGSLQQTLRTTVETLSVMEGNKFIHVIANRLRELITYKS